MKFPFRYLVISDVHLNHKTNKTRDIIDNLIIFLDKLNQIELDCIFIAGDLLDGLMDANSDELIQYIDFCHYLLNYVNRRNIKLRVVRGTLSHDWNQLEVLVSINSLIAKEGVDIDFKYFNEPYIEHMKDLDLYILYMPDNYANNDAAIALKTVKELLRDKQIDKVDIAIMHGLMDVQLPGIGSDKHKHCSKEYLDLVRYFINIGHHHTFSFYTRIIVQGSFDRLAQGQEEAKGAVYVNIAGESREDNSFIFIENERAKTYKRLYVDEKHSLDKNIKELNKQLTQFRDDSYIEIAASPNHAIHSYLDEFKRNYTMLNISSYKIPSKNTTIDDILIEKEVSYETVAITSENIEQLLIEEVRNREKISDRQFGILKNILQSCR